eukprot:3160160-Rhodomonas_salina.1
MNDFFTVSDDGDLNWYLGVNYERTGTGIVAKQTAYLQRCLERFGLTDAKTKSVPLPPKFVITEDELPKHPNAKDIEEYRAMIGCLLWMSVWTRPDIAFA